MRNYHNFVYSYWSSWFWTFIVIGRRTDNKRKKRDNFVQESNANLIPALLNTIGQTEEHDSIINNSVPQNFLYLSVWMKGTQSTRCNLQSNTTLPKADSWWLLRWNAAPYNPASKQRESKYFSLKCNLNKKKMHTDKENDSVSTRCYKKGNKSGLSHFLFAAAGN